MPHRPAGRESIALVAIHKALKDLQSLVRRLVRVTADSRAAITSLPEVILMALKPEIQAAVDRVTAAIQTEAGQISQKVTDLIAAVQAGQDPAETVAALDAIAQRVDALSDSVPDTPPTT